MTAQASTARTRYVDGAWHRLHPATPLLRGGIWLLAVLLYVGGNLREHLVTLVFGLPDVGGDPVDEIGRHDLVLPAALIVLGVILLSVGAFWLSWRASEFRIDGDDVTVRYGVLLRRTRTAKLDRIQGVRISRPLLARLVGAARVELDVAGQNANVRLEYLSNGAAEELRGDVLALASGHREAEAPEGEEPESVEAAVLTEPGTPVVTVTPGRAIGSVLLSETLVALVVIVAVVVPVLAGLGAGPAAAVSFVPVVIGSVTVLGRRIGRNLRFSVVSTRDGVRVSSGVVSTSTEAVPPGRVHALHIEQPLLWRPAGWWRVAVNRAGHAAGRRNAESERSLAPVATTAEVLTLLPLLVPDLEDQRDLLVAGLVGRGDEGDFTPAPRRARWLRPLAWRRTGFRLTDASVLARSGFLRRELVVVPDARMQSVSLRQGPLQRLLRVATVHPHVVSGPVRTTLRLVDADRAQRLFVELEEIGVGARRRDVSHRWRDLGTQR
ncbi:PH domain-containing protein [Amnibacterium kyonggiense]|uniref:Putative membrane protein n=1 Tax=Amnibacterium kyonggiense TaxID=595671 RepID=A0A4R7FQG6_9MICO|nr:PH domain-containing protein [Amnibacterium kyonggiense]TDS80021.1 putative membrane protein [Amnibacterium kyonggiense]